MSNGAIEQAAEPSAAIPPADSGKPDVQQQAVVDKGDFDARVRSDPEFALEQVKEAQRQLTKYQGKFGKLESVVEGAGGADNLLGYLNRLAPFVSNPQVRQLMEHFDRTGAIPERLNGNGHADPEPEFEEPWDKSVKPVASEVQQLRQELNRLRADRGVEKNKGFFRQFWDEYPVAEEHRAALAEAMANEAQQWSKTPQGLHTLENMDYPTFSALALRKLTKDQLRSAFAREDEARAALRQQSATDSPPRVQRTGRESAVDLSPQEAFIKACREEGIDPYRPLPIKGR